MYVCEICSREYKQKRSLIRHSANHNSAKFVCKICTASFKRLDNLKRHTRNTHENSLASSASPVSSSFKCVHCPANFIAQENLAAHVKKFHSQKRKLENETPVPRKKQRRQARERLAHLPDESDNDDDHSFDHEDVKLNAVLRENWQGIKTHTRVTKNSTFINVRWTEASPPDFAAALTPFFQEAATKFKIQASHGFILKKKHP